MLGELLFLHLQANFLQSTWANLPASKSIKMKAHDRRCRFVLSTVTTAVSMQWKVVVGAINAARNQIRKGLKKVLVPARKARAMVLGKIREKTAVVVDPVVDKLLKPMVMPLALAVSAQLLPVFRNLPDALRTATDDFVKKASATGSDVEMEERALEHNVKRPSVLTGSMKHLATAAKLCSKPTGFLPDSIKDQLGKLMDKLDTGFDVSGWVKRQESELLRLADASAYTFAEEWKEAGRPPANYAALQTKVTVAYGADAKPVLQEGVRSFCYDAVNDVFVAKVLDKCGPLLDAVDRMIPRVVKKFVTVRGCLEALLSAIVNMAAKRAAEEVVAKIEVVAVVN